jgi:hypothetical protein
LIVAIDPPLPVRPADPLPRDPPPSPHLNCSEAFGINFALNCAIVRLECIVQFYEIIKGD